MTPPMTGPESLVLPPFELWAGVGRGSRQLGPVVGARHTESERETEGERERGVYARPKRASQQQHQHKQGDVGISFEFPCRG